MEEADEDSKKAELIKLKKEVKEKATTFIFMA